MNGFAKSSMLGYMATWTTYGSWLQGDERGYVKDGTILIANQQLKQANQERLKHKKITLSEKHRQIVKNAILKEAAEIGQTVYAISVCSNHVHIIVKSIAKTVGYSVGRFKKAATQELRKHGFKDKVWTKGFDKRYCYTAEELQQKIRYVQRHK